MSGPKHDNAASAPFRLRRWTIFPDRLTLVGPAGRRTLEAMSMRLLLALAAKAPDTLTRDQIIDAVWDGRVVTDDAINKQVSKLRSALADRADSAPLVQTVPKVGVRLAESPRQPALTSARSWAKPVSIALVAAAAISFLVLALPSRERVPELVESPLTATPGAEYDPALSGDGSKVAYVARTANAPARLLVRSMARDDARVISPEGVEAAAPAWSPVGSLAFAGHLGNLCYIYVALPGRAPRPVAACVAPEFGGLAWLNKSALIVSDRPGLGRSYQLELLDVGTRRSRPLLAPLRGDIGDTHPLVSRDGSSVYFLRNSTVGASQLFSLSLANRSITRLAASDIQISSVALGPDDTLVVSAQRDASGPALWLFSLRSGHWSRLGPASATDLAGSAEGRTLAYSKVERQTVLWRLPLTGNEPGEPLTPSTRSDWSPVASPDGKKLAFLSDRSGSEEVWLMDLVTGKARPLTSFGGPKIQDLSWSADSSVLLTSVPNNGQFDIARIDVATGRVTSLAQTGMDERHAAFTAGSSALLFVRRMGQRFDLRRYDFAAGRDVAVMSGVMRLVPLAPQDTLIFTRPFENGVWISTAGGAPRLLVDFPAVTRMRDITISGRTLWAVRSDADGERLMAKDLQTGVARPTRVLPGIARPSGIAIIGNSVVYARTMRVEADLVSLRLRY